MEDILLSLQDPIGWLVISGAGLQVGAHLLRDQVALRLILLVGTCLYIAYYASLTDGPLWPAIISSSFLAAASVVGLARVLVRRHLR